MIVKKKFANLFLLTVRGWFQLAIRGLSFAASELRVYGRILASSKSLFTEPLHRASSKSLFKLAAHYIHVCSISV
jgi:hypothetical protein